jgi:divalent metal cation (Fe/Co/Zn/Cd) transporter
VSLSLAVLGLTAVAQTIVFLATDSIALLADLDDGCTVRR